MPSTTRWYSIQTMISSFIRGQTVLQRMAIDKNIYLDKNVTKIMRNDDFWEKLNNLFNFLEPLISGIIQWYWHRLIWHKHVENSA